MIGGNVDKKIVEMQFDNDQFEKDVSKTMGTLDKLKESLSFANVKDGFDKIQNGILGLNLGPVEDGLLAVQDGFGMMEMIGLQAMSRISNAVLDMGQKLVNAVTIDPIKSGLEEYETQINAVQTIMSNTEEAFKDSTEQEHLNEVNKALDELNTYADKTIYNFTEMTRNIGTFTAAGVSLDESKTAIQGIANMAAVSGSNAQQASTAMYQLSQALAAGSVKLQDWNSVVNAGMGGEVFKKALQESSKAMVVANEKVQKLASSGKNAEQIAAETGIELGRVQKLLENGYANSYDTAIKKHGTFRESLTDGWITSEVLIDTLRNATLNFSTMTEEEQKATKAMLLANGYTEEQIEDIGRLGKNADEAATKVKTFSQLIDTTKEALQSGWTQSWEYIIGDFGEARDLWTKVSDYLGNVINESANARNEVLKQWHDAGGRTLILEGLTSGFKGITSVFKEMFGSINEYLGEFMPIIDGNFLIEFSKKFKAFADGLNPTKETLEKIGDVVSNLTRPLMIVGDVYFALQKNSGSFLGLLSKIGSVFGHIIDDLGLFIKFGTDVIRGAGIPEKLVNGLVKGIDWLGTAIGNTYSNLRKFIFALTGFTPFLAKRDIWKNLYSEKLSKFLDDVGAKFTKLKTSIGTFFSTINNFVKRLTGINLEKVFSWESAINGARKFHNIIVSLPKTFTDIKTKISTFFSGIAESISKFTGLDLHKPTWDEFKQTLDNIVDTIKHWKENFATAKTAVVEFLTGLWTKLAPIRTGFSQAKDAVLNFFTSFKKDKNPDAEEGMNFLGALAKAGQVIGDTFEKIFTIVSNVAKKIFIKIKEIKDKVNFKDIFAGLLGGAGTLGLLNLASLLGKLNKVAKGEGLDVLQFLDDITDKLKGAVETFKEIMEPFGDTLAAFQNKLKADMLKNIALAVGILVGSLVVISLVDQDKLGIGIAAIGSLMGELMGAVAIFTKTVGDTGTKEFASVSLAFVKLAGSVLILAIALRAIASLEPEQMFQGLAGIGIMIAMLNATMTNLDNLKDAKGMVKACEAMIFLAIAIRALVGPVKKLGELNFEVLTKGLIGVGALLAALGLFTKFSEAEKIGVKNGIGILLLAFAIKSLANTVMIFTALDYDQLNIGLTGLAVTLGALGLFTRFSEAEKMGIRSGLGIILLAKAIDMLANTTMIFKDLDWEQLGKGLAGVAGVLLAMGLFTRFANADKAGVLSGIGLILLAKAVDMIAETAKGFARLRWEQIVKGLGSVVVILTAISLAANAMKGTAGGSASVILMAIALNILVPAIKNFGELPLETIGKGLLTLAGTFTILGIAGAILTPVIPAILGLAGALLMISAATLLFGAGMTVIVTAVGILRQFEGVIKGIKWEIYIDIFKRVLEMLAGLIPGFVKLVVDTVLAIVTSIAEAIPTICQAVVTVVSAILVTLEALVPQIVRVGLRLLIVLLTAIDANIDKILLLGVSIIIKLIDGIAVAAPALVEAGVNLIISLVNGMAEAIMNNADSLIQAFDNVFWSIIYTLLALVQSAAEKLPGIGGLIADKIEGIKEDIKGKVNFEEGKKVTDDAISGVKAGIDDGEEPVRQSTKGLVDTVNDGLKDIDSSGIGDAVKTGVVNGMTSAKGDAEDTAGLIGAGVDNVFSNYDTSGGGTEMVRKVFTGMKGSEDDMFKNAANLGDKGLEGFLSVDGKGSGEDLVNQIIGGFNSDSSIKDMQNAGLELGQAGAGDSGFGGSYADYYKSGGYVLEGSAQGMYDNVDVVRDAAAYAGTESLNAYNKASGVASPSWKFAQSGMFQMLGGAEGIRKNVGMLIAAAEYAGNETVDAFSESISDLSDMANLNIDDQPSIRPVLDLSNIQNGVGQIDSLFSRRMATSVTVRPTMNSMDISSAVGGLADLTGKGNGDIVSTLKTQIAMTSQLINVLKNQKIYLDGKTCVGGMVNEIDKQLGRKQILAGRRGRG